MSYLFMPRMEYCVPDYTISGFLHLTPSLTITPLLLIKLAHACCCLPVLSSGNAVPSPVREYWVTLCSLPEPPVTT